MSGGSVLKIDTLNDRYYVLFDDIYGNEFMGERCFEEFAEEIKKYENVCLNSWDKQVKATYQAICKYVEIMKEERSK